MSFHDMITDEPKAMLIPRSRYLDDLRQRIKEAPCVALLGPRQAGKSTLAKQITPDHLFDLENPRDLARLDDAQLALEGLTGLIVIDKVQRQPELFPLLRYLIDQNPEQRFLLLGSAFRDLIRASSESLAGRIQYVYLAGFDPLELAEDVLGDLWLRGGFPRSFLATSEEASVRWREAFITDYLERDIPQLGIRIPPRRLSQFWMMLSHYHAGIVRYTDLAASLDISDKTARSYIDILAATFMVRLLQPWSYNTKKRLVKRPKLYIADSGIFHTLQTIESRTQLDTHPKLGASWEGFCITSIQNMLGLSAEKSFFWAVHNQGELDLLWQKAGRLFAVEVKYSSAPKRTRSMTLALNELGLEHLWVIYPGDITYALDKKITACSLRKFALLHRSA